MNPNQAEIKLREVLRRKHFALSTEQSYAAWLVRFMRYVVKLPANWSSEQKLEAFLTALAKDDVSASTQNQAFNALLFFYRDCLGLELKNISALRAKRESSVQRAVRSAGRRLKLEILPHELRHAYATHCLNRGTNPRAIQQAMGHKSLETTMGYLHAEALSVPSPLEVLG